LADSAWILRNYFGADQPITALAVVGVAVAGLLFSAMFAKESIQHAKLEAKLQQSVPETLPKANMTKASPSLGQIFAHASWKDRNLFACSQAGLVNNLNDGMSWGIYPLFFAGLGLGVAAIGTIKAATRPPGECCRCSRVR
jgi:hypothetical protein